MTLRSIIRLLFAGLLLTTACSAAPTDETPDAAASGEAWPRRVLLTNDNGIDDVALAELARALAKVTETHVVANTTDRSGTTNLLSAVRTGEFRVERRNLGEGIEAYALDGYPADCVLFAMTGPLRERPPDLVISGINGGPNLADEWFGSGTIGAARTAAYLGIPAVAVSGVEDDDPASVRAAVDWVVKLARSEAVRRLRPPHYLTVSIPETPSGELAVVTRGRGLMSGAVRLVEDGAIQTWSLELELDPRGAPADTDVAAYRRGAIAVVAMRVDESDRELAALLRGAPSWFPTWSSSSAAAVPPTTRCPSGLGIVFDDAEDADGREWGVLLEEVMPGGRAEQIGLRAGDVIVSLNGVGLEVPRRSREDPDDKFLELLGRLDCGDEVALDFVRDGERGRASYRIAERAGK